MLPFIVPTEGRDVLLRNDAVHNSTCTRQDECRKLHRQRHECRRQRPF